MIFSDLGLYYSLSIGNSQEQLEDLNRAGEIAGKSKFFLTVFLCIYLLGRFSNCNFFFFFKYIRYTYRRSKSFCNFKNNTSHIVNGLNPCVSLVRIV